MLDNMTATQTGCVSVNGLEIYYERHGSGKPLIVLHGAYMTIPTMGDIIPRLAQNCAVIAVELQGHGRTADIDRPITYEAMADDIAAFITALGLEKADLFGYSMGAGVALQVALRHPERVDRLIMASVGYSTDGLHPGLMDMWETITPEMFAGTPFEADYLRLSPHPEKFPTLVKKLTELDSQTFTWPTDAIEAIQSPAFLIVGDADIVTLEHAVDLFRHLGGGKNGDLHGLSKSRLAILPASTHLGVISRVDWLHSMITDFLAIPA